MIELSDGRFDNRRHIVDRVDYTLGKNRKIQRGIISSFTGHN
jgi:hypothetical protein